MGKDDTGVGLVPAGGEGEARRAPRRTLEEKIADAAANLKSLQDEKRARDAAANAENEKAVRRLLNDEKLWAIGVDAWRKAMPAIRAALGLGT